MQIVIQVILDEITDKLRYRRAVRSYIFRAELGLCLALEYRLLHFYADSGHDTRTNIRILEILIVIFLDDTAYRLLESRKVRTALGGMLAVHERLIFLSILVAMRDNHLYILPFQVDDRVKRLGGHILVQQIHQTVAGIETLAVVNNGKSRVQEDIVL